MVTLVAYGNMALTTKRTKKEKNVKISFEVKGRSSLKYNFISFMQLIEDNEHIYVTLHLNIKLLYGDGHIRLILI